MVLLEILEADLQMELASARNDVLARLLNDTLYHGVRLGEALEAFDQLGQVRWVLGLDGDAHDGGHRELHDLHVVRILGGGDGAGLDEELVNSDKTADVACGNVLDG